MKTLSEFIEEAKKELHEHPAMKFANDAIVLDAIRSGTKGYEGEEHLGQFLERKLRECAELTAAAGEIPEEIVRTTDGGYNRAIQIQRSQRAKWIGK